MAKKLLTKIYSEGGPQSGQGWRSSGDFSINAQGYNRLVWEIEENENADNIVFSVAKDVRGSDKKVYIDLVNGTVTKVADGENLYIGGVSGTGGQGFTVCVYGR